MNGQLEVVEVEAAGQNRGLLEIRNLSPAVLIAAVEDIGRAVETLLSRGMRVTRRRICEETGLHPVIVQRLVRLNDGLRELMEDIGAAAAAEAEDILIEIAQTEERTIMTNHGDERIVPAASKEKMKAIEVLLKGRHNAYRDTPSTVVNNTTFIQEQKILSVEDAQDYFTRQRLSKPSGPKR